MARASRKVASPRVVSVEDLRPLARGRVPRAVFDYLDGGAEGEVTLRENCRAFADLTFRPRHAVALAECNLRTRALGADLAVPFMLAPVGYSRLMHPGGEVAAARAAGRAGTAYILSTISGHRLEDVKAASAGPVLYQLYLLGGRAAAEASIDRARVAGFAGLVVTIDTPVAGIRERDLRNGMKELVGPGLLDKIPFLPNILSHPGWLTVTNSARITGATTNDYAYTPHGLLVSENAANKNWNLTSQLRPGYDALRRRVALTNLTLGIVHN